MVKSTTDLEGFLEARPDKTRLCLLILMGDQAICVCSLVEVLGGPQPKMSRRLAYLRSAGVAAARREGAAAGTPANARSAARRKRDAGGPDAPGLLFSGQVRVRAGRAQAGESRVAACAFVLDASKHGP